MSLTGTPFRGPLAATTEADLRRLVEEQFPEGQAIEFKETLPAKGNGSPDSWLAGGDSFGNRARNELLEEIVAFANSTGGYLCLGIRETQEAPPRAKDLAPVPRCTELAQRLEMQIRDCIDPQLPAVEVQPVVVSADGSGVVLVHAPSSRMAPHRVTTTLNATIRRANRSESMTMREIQDLTLQRDRGLAAMDAELRRRADAFDGRLVELGRQGHSAVGIRVTLVPVGSSLFVPRVYGNADVSPVEEEFRARFGAWEGELHSPARTNRVRPIIRGARHVARETTHELLIDVMCDGTIDFTYLNTQPPPQDNVFSEWLFGITLNGLLSAIRLRSAAGAPATEYAVEVELRSVNKALAFRPFYSTSTADPSAGANHVRFPRLSLGSTDEWKRVLNILLRDAYNAAGRDPAGGW